MNKILIPINNAQTVDTVVRELKSLSHLLIDSSITLLYVQTLVYDTSAGLYAVVATPGVEREGRLVLQKASQRFKEMRLLCRTVLKTGDPVQEICQYAAEEVFDLIVVCRREQNLLERLLLNSISDELIEKASTNVLVLK